MSNLYCEKRDPFRVDWPGSGNVGNVRGVDNSAEDSQKGVKGTPVRLG